MKKAIAWALDSVGKPMPLNSGAFDLEKHLEEWVDTDASIVADDVLLIGRQVSTSYWTVIDLLGIDSQGNLVIIELKRDQTLRETVAQGIEYAAWCSKLSYDDICAIATKRYASQEAFATAFQEQFGQSLPETLNDGQRILLVAPEISDSTAAVIEYLSQTYQVPINGVSFDVFDVDGRKIVVRHLVREETAEPPIPPKKSSIRTLDEFKSAADQNGVGEAFEHLLELQDLFPTLTRYSQCVLLRGLSPSKKSRGALTIYPTADTNPNTLQVWLYPNNLAELFSVSPVRSQAFVESVRALGESSYNSSGWLRLALSNLDKATEFARRFREFVDDANQVVPPNVASEVTQQGLASD